ncbi:Purine-binding protein [Moorella thermoacetica]|uniref:Purine-binding protein n=1 Tax=Neomoorella thermoacetica TaxID=1525 RepID=A0AAC9HJ34_NEOTH|nr:BMP family protein [Moorella thermoacetica]AOQ25107.1 Purine-binding protein precursor [Moorella thermoacetica]TYL15362.1 Purine-binding protein [Moorella thermoacetica]
MYKRNFLMFVVLLILGAMLTGLAGCGNKNNQPAPGNQQGESQGKKQVKVGAIYSIPDPANGGGWDRVQIPGQEVLKNEFGWEVSIAESVPYSKVSEVAGSYADKGYDMVILPDNGMVDSWNELPKKYPNTWFVLMSITNQLPEGEKVAAWSPDMYTHGTVVGMVAAKASKSGVIGVVGGTPIPALTVQFSGIIEGAKAVRPDAKVLISWVGNWEDVGKHSEATSLLIQQGADIIFTVTGPGYKGVYEAAEKKGVPVIGYASDWYKDAPNVILTSVLFDGPKMYRDMAKAYESGKMEKKITTLGMDYINLADFHGKLSPEVEKDIKETFAKMKSGELKIPVKIHAQLKAVN